MAVQGRKWRVLNARPPSLGPPRVLVIADDDASAQAVALRLGDAFASSLRLSAGRRPAAADAADARADIVILAAGSLDRVEADALAIRASARAGAPAPQLVGLCAVADLARASRLCTDGALDDYAAHPADSADPGRLLVAVRAAARWALAPRPTAPARVRPIVLVVEDDEFAQQLVTMTLESADIEIVVEHDGAVALDRIRAVRPDLVLMDVMLPTGDGVELTQHMKADPALAGIPVVMLTGDARREVLVRSMEAGASDFIVKPFTPAALLGKLSRFLPNLS